MDLQSLLRPGGDPVKPFVYALLYAFVGASGLLAAALQYSDWIWAADIAYYSAISTVMIFAIAHGLAATGMKRLSAPWALGISVVAGCLLAQMLDIFIFDTLSNLPQEPHGWFGYRLAYARGPILWWGLGVCAWYMLKRAERHAAEVARVQLAAEELRASTAEARLQALQAQVEPHFLFNTLANVKWLYRRDGDSGRRMLDRLIDYLQAALPRVRQSTTTLEQELQLARAYLDIQQIRIGGRLAFDIDVPAEVAGVRIPPLMLLTLVENSIKHGIAPQTEGGTIGIRALAGHDKLRIEVRDTGAGLRESRGTGMGLANVRARLAALFGAGARLVIEPNVPHGVVAAIEIPR